MNFDERKRRWLNNLPEKYRPNSVHKLNALSNVDTRNKIYFGDRQTGRTHLLMLDIAYDLLKGTNKRLCVLTPNQQNNSYIHDKLNELLIDVANDDIKRTTRNPLYIEMKNGNRVYVVNIENNMRGHRFDNIYIDNLNYINEMAFQRALICCIHNEDARIIANSLPIQDHEEVTALIARRILGGN